MRPVTKPNPPPNYIFFDQASLQNNTVTFHAGAITIVYAQAAPFTPTVEWVQDEVLRTGPLHGAFPVPSSGLNRARARNIMKDRLAAIYGQARLDLNATIGDYCSYCELPGAGHVLAVEHRAPKAEYPTYTVLWENFVICCAVCNSYKGDRPDRATTANWSPAAHPTEAQLVTQVRNRYFWPDLNQQTYRVVDRHFYYDTQAVAPTLMVAAEYASPLNRLRSAINHVVRADVFANGAMQMNESVEVTIGANGGGVRGPRTVQLPGLQHQEDYRSQYRTTTWLRVCAHVHLLQTQVAAAALAHKQNTFDGQWAALLMAATGVGFYSVWVKVLCAVGFPAGVNAGVFANLGEKFVHDTLPANNPNPLQTFPGTDDAQVP
jgi:hypothetical protein